MGANAFALDRWGNNPMNDALREGHKQVASILGHGMDQKITADGVLPEYRHMEEVRQWCMKDAGLREGAGLARVLETFDSEGVETVELVEECWLKVEPLLKAGPAARISKALRSRRQT